VARFDYFSEAYVTAADFDAAQKFLDGSRSLPHLPDHIKKIVDQPNRSYSAVESDSASLLILNEWFTPAWKVRLNGKRQPTLRVNEWQTGVLLPAGKNLAEFEYRPNAVSDLNGIESNHIRTAAPLWDFRGCPKSAE
jgi:uncharacterized membrane protein YfhO